MKNKTLKNTLLFCLPLTYCLYTAASEPESKDDYCSNIQYTLLNQNTLKHSSSILSVRLIKEQKSSTRNDAWCCINCLTDKGINELDRRYPGWSDSPIWACQCLWPLFNTIGEKCCNNNKTSQKQPRRKPAQLNKQLHHTDHKTIIL